MGLLDTVYKAFKWVVDGSVPLTSLAGGLDTGDYNEAIRQSDRSSVIMACVIFISDAILSTPLVLYDDQQKEQPESPLARVLANPNPALSGEQLRATALAYYLLTGNAYWLKIYNRRGELVEFWPLYNERLTPKVRVNEIVYYEYKNPNGRFEKFDVEDVVHFRRLTGNTSSPLGVSPLDALAPEIILDNNATAFTHYLLKNMGIAGMVVKVPPNKNPKIDDVLATRKYLQENYRGKKRGDPMVVGENYEVQMFKTNTTDLFLPQIHNFSEERVCAVYQVPAAVIGFGTGLQQTKVGATLEELERQAWQNGVIPVQSDFTHTIMQSVQGNFEGIENWNLAFDLSGVRALREDELKQTQMWNARVMGGWSKVSEARAATGMEVRPQDEVFLRRTGVVAVPDSTAILDQAEALIEDSLNPTPPPQLPDRSTNGQPDDDPQGEGTNGEAAETGAEVRAYAAQAGQGAASNPTLEAKDGENGQPAVQVSQPAAEAVAPTLKRVTSEARRLAAAFRRSEAEPRAQFEDDLVDAFNNLGERAHDAFLRLEDTLTTSARRLDVKQEERIDLTELMDSIDVPEWTALYLRRAYNTYFLALLRNTVQDIETVTGAAVNLPDAVQRSVIDAGGTRLALLDIDGQTRAAVYETVAAGRAAGHSPDQIALRIQEAVPAGPFKNAGVEYRAQLIARTEARYAQNISSLAASEGMDGVDRVMLLDAQLGPTDAECEARNGRIVSFDEAKRIIELEHPNGSLDIIPYFG